MHMYTRTGDVVYELWNTYTSIIHTRSSREVCLDSDNILWTSLTQCSCEEQSLLCVIREQGYDIFRLLLLHPSHNKGVTILDYSADWKCGTVSHINAYKLMWTQRKNIVYVCWFCYRSLYARIRETPAHRGLWTVQLWIVVEFCSWG